MIAIDLETYSTVDIKSAGAFKYARHAEIMLFAYRFEDWDECKLWDVTDGGPMPAELEDALRDPQRQVLAHNATFEQQVLLHSMGLDIPWERWEDTMVLALTAGLPGKMETLCEALGLDEDTAKLADGSRLIQLFCKPAPKNHKVRRYTKVERPEEWARFGEYCMRDVDVSWLLWRTIPHWTYDTERPAWRLDQAINARGLPYDVELSAKAIDLVDAEVERCNAELAELTGGYVTKVTNTEAMRSWLETQGVHTKSLAKHVVEALLAGDLPDNARRLLEIRQRAGKAGVAKFQKGQESHIDGRLYGSLAFYGAHTGRWAGRGVQPQNMARPTLGDLHTAVEALKSGLVELLYDDPMEVASSCARAVVGAPDGRKLVVADLANVEGRKLAWLAGEEWKLEAFREQDAGGVGVYERSYASSFGIPVERVNGEQRQIGKVQELALGFQGGPAAYVSMAKVYRLEPDSLVEPVRTSVNEAVWEHARETWSPKRGRGLPQDTWTALHIIVQNWRAAHPAIRSYWYDQERAAVAAVNKPGAVMGCRGLKWLATEHNGYRFLLCRLPSGRRLCYFDPEVHETTIRVFDNETGEEKVIEKLQLSYMGYHEYKWHRIKTYGGKLTENITQASCRDLLVRGMQNAEEAGYEIVLTVHDELLTETPDDERYSVAELAGFMTELPTWAEGLPLAAAGYEDKFYRKD